MKKEDISKRMTSRIAFSFFDVIERFNEWMYLEPEDNEFIEVATAAVIDREIPGDPVWLMLVAPSGAMKSELIRSFTNYSRAFTLDHLTPHTLISGLTKKNPDTGEYEPRAGIMQDLDGKCLLLKDFTTVLSQSDETRTAIYGQLRAAYDGYLEKGFGTMRKPVRIRASFGLVAGCTPVIDKYTKMTGALGERFLIIRSSPDIRKAAEKATLNTGSESEMRAQLSGSMSSFLSKIKCEIPPVVSRDVEKTIVDFGTYIAYMRTRAYVRYSNGAIWDMDPLSPEVPTRVSKQLKKLGQCLCILREHEEVSHLELSTLARVSRDTATPRRQRIMDVFEEVGFDIELNASDISGLSRGERKRGLHHQTVKNELQIMEILGIVESNDYGSNYKISEHFLPFVEAVYRYPPNHLQKELLKQLISASDGGGGY